jgi:hypothetical protein
MQLANWRILSHPINWLTVLLMLIIAGLFGHYLLTMFDQSPATKDLVTTNLSTQQLSPSQQDEKLDFLREE